MKLLRTLTRTAILLDVVFALAGCSQIEQARVDYPWMDNVLLALALAAAVVVSNAVRLRVFSWRGTDASGVRAHTWAWTAFWGVLLVFILLILYFYAQATGSR